MNLSIFNEAIKRTRFLIVGGDGLIGAALNESIRLQGGDVATTSRHRGAALKKTMFLDFQDEKGAATLDVSGYAIAYFCAGLSKYSDIEANVSISHLINVTNTLHLCSRLMEAGCSVVFLSTSAVFDGKHPYPAETDPVCPTTHYGQQKHEVENVLTAPGKMPNAPGVVKIVRLSKVLAPNTPLINGWRNSLSRGEIIAPFMDLRLSPVSLPYVVGGLLRIGMLEQPGIFHLSGARDVTYADIANELALRWGYPLNLVCPVTSMDSGISLPYAPKHPSLGMTRTTRATAIAPQLFEDCIADLANTAV